MKIAKAALSIVAVLSKPNSGRSEGFLRGEDSKESPPPERREKKDTGKLPVELEYAPPGCNVPDPDRVHDGICDKDGGYNTEACNYDGGDCCKRTCGASLVFGNPNCGSNGYDCKDPQFAPPGCIVPDYDRLGDDICDKDGGYNTEVCGWDGRDCCETTCGVGRLFRDPDCGSNGYDCKDPHSSSREDPFGPGGPLPPGCNVLMPSLIGNGLCDTNGGYNTEACNYDGGDCCESTCVSESPSYAINCGAFGYDCKDPFGTSNKSDEYGLPQEEAEVM